MRYTGWIPTITGHLSFSSIGITSFPTKSDVSLLSDGRLVSQTRDLLDLALPFADNSSLAKYFREQIANKVLSITGKFTFICTLPKTNNQEILRGKIYIVSPKHRAAVCKDIKTKLSQGDLGQVSSTQIVSLMPLEKLSYTCDYELERGGRIVLSPVSAEKLDYMDATEKRELDLLIANQSFFFFKDISHVHQHHDPSHDAITQVVPTTGSAGWASEIQKQLYRSIIRSKRHRKEQSLFRASGLLAYARAFEKTYCSDDDSRQFNTDELEQSLSVSRQEIIHFDNKRISFLETIKNFFLGVFGLIISLALLARFDDEFSLEPDTIYLTILDYIAQKPVPVGTVLACFAVVYGFATHQRDPANYKLIRMALRLTQHLQTRYTYPFNYVIVLVLLFLAYLVTPF